MALYSKYTRALTCENLYQAPFKTEIPEVLRQKYGSTKLSRKLRKGLLTAEESPLFQRDAAGLFCHIVAIFFHIVGLFCWSLLTLAVGDAADFRARGGRGRGRGDKTSHRDGPDEVGRQSSMKSMLQRLAIKVDKISRKTSDMDSTLSRVTSVLHYAS